MSRVVPQDPKSIKQLEKELFKAHKESKTNIKEVLKIKIEDIELEEIYKAINSDSYKEFKESFTKIQEKINLFDDLIKKLENIKPSQKWKTIKPPKALKGHINEPTDNRPNSQLYQPIDKSTVGKHIKYLEYLKNILETKMKKDVKIMNLFNAVMNNTNGIIDAINQINEIIDRKQNFEKREKLKELKENKKNIMKFEINKCSKDLKKKLDEISNLSNINQKIEKRKIGGSLLSSKLNKYNKQIEKNLNTLINSVNKIQSSNQKGGTNFQVNNAIIKNLGLVDILQDNKENAKKTYTEDLKKIKDAYEKGLKENIEDFKAICKALTEYLKKLQGITKNFLKNFFERSNEFMKEKKNIYEDAKKKITDKLIEYLNQKKKFDKSTVQNFEKQINNLLGKKININTYRDDSLINIIELSNTIETLQENKEISENKLNEINLEKLFLEMKNNNSKNNIETLKQNINDLNKDNEELNKDNKELEDKETKLQNLISYFKTMGIELLEEKYKLIEILDERGDSIESSKPALRRVVSNTAVNKITPQGSFINTSKNKSKNNSNIMSNSKIIERINYFNFYLRITSMYGFKVIEQLKDVENKINENITKIEENIKEISNIKKTIKEQKNEKQQKQENLKSQKSKEQYTYDLIIDELEGLNNYLKEERERMNEKKEKIESIKVGITEKIKQLKTEAFQLLEYQDNEQEELNKKIPEKTSEIITNLDDYLNNLKNINNLNNVTNVINKNLSTIINDTRSSLLELYKKYEIIDENVKDYKFDENKNEILE